MTPFANELGPTFNELRPFARSLPELNASTEKFATAVTPVIKNEIRPFVRTASEPVGRPERRGEANREDQPAPARRRSAASTVCSTWRPTTPAAPSRPSTPNRNEGYLYWAAWLGHNSNSVFEVADGNGLARRIYLTASCANVTEILASNALAPLVTGLGPLFAAGGPCDPTAQADGGGGGLPPLPLDDGSGGSARAEPESGSELEPLTEPPDPSTEPESSADAPPTAVGGP